MRTCWPATWVGILWTIQNCTTLSHHHTGQARATKLALLAQPVLTFRGGLLLPGPDARSSFPTRRLLPCRAVSPVGRNASRSACKKERLKGLIYSCSQTTQFIQGRAKNGSPCTGRDQGRRRRHLFLSPPHCTRSARGARGRSPCEEEEESEGGGASIRKSSMLR